MAAQTCGSSSTIWITGNGSPHWNQRLLARLGLEREELVYRSIPVRQRTSERCQAHHSARSRLVWRASINSLLLTPS